MFIRLPKMLVFEIKIPEGNFKITGYIDTECLQPMNLFTQAIKQFGRACARAYLKYRNDMVTKCFFVNTEFVNQLGKLQTQAFTDCNYLSIDDLGKSQPTNHHMIHLVQKDLVFAVDVAAQQFRKDDVIAEIFIAKNNKDLFDLLTIRHGTNQKWELNQYFEGQNEKLKKMLHIGKTLKCHIQQNDMQINDRAFPIEKKEEDSLSSSKLCVIL